MSRSRRLVRSLLARRQSPRRRSRHPASCRTARASTASAIAAWIHVDAPPGGESFGQRVLSPILPGWRSDAFGNLVKRIGSGSPRRVVACAMDVPGFVVSQITDDGLVRLHRAGVPGHPLWDQFHEAQQVRVLTARGAVTGVVAIANGHFARQHRGDTAIVTVDQLWVDLGVESRAQAMALGVALLDPVVAIRPVWTYEGYASGPAAGARASCAAVASAAQSARVPTGETIFVLSTQRSFGWVGLSAVLARLGTVDAITLLDEGRDVARTAVTSIPALRLGTSRQRLARVLPVSLSRDSVQVVVPRVRFAGSLVESIHADDARAVMRAALVAAGSVDTVVPWIAPRVDTATVRTTRRDAYDAAEKTFLEIADLAGVPGHEWRVRDAITALFVGVGGVARHDRHRG
ncbi:MAG: hypothetical protein IPP90_03985 [Gemmatimonadaceae bacterium]|nr:hypothetical protein [Gemmatimonadaceae bacterium]